MKKRIIILFALLLVCSGLGIIHSKAKQPEVIDRDGFYIVDGVLVRYTGELAKGKEIVLPDEVKTIGSQAFALSNYLNYYEEVPEEWKTYYMKLVVPKGVELAYDAFQHCISLDIYFGEGIKTLDRGANTGSSCWCKVHLPKTLREVKDFTFSSCDRTRVYLNEGLEKIGVEAFRWATVDNILPKSLKKIGDSAFFSAALVDKETDFISYRNDQSETIYDTSLLKSPVLPEGLKSIGDEAFSGASHVSRLETRIVKIPASVKHIGLEAFGSNGTSSYRYKVDKKNKYYWSDKNGWLYSKDKKTLYFAALDYEHNVIPEHVRNIEFLSLATYLDNNYMERELLKIYFPKKLEKVTRYPGALYHCVFIFRGKKAPTLIKYKGNDTFEDRKDRRDKWLHSKENYFVVKKGLKSKFIKNLKLGNYPKKRIKER